MCLDCYCSSPLFALYLLVAIIQLLNNLLTDSLPSTAKLLTSICPITNIFCIPVRLLLIQSSEHLQYIILKFLLRPLGRGYSCVLSPFSASALLPSEPWRKFGGASCLCLCLCLSPIQARVASAPFAGRLVRDRGCGRIAAKWEARMRG